MTEHGSNCHCQSKGLPALKNWILRTSTSSLILSLRPRIQLYRLTLRSHFISVSNCASQALFNSHEFFRDAGPKYEADFFEKVRFFSVVANRTGLLVRIHRAVEIPEDEVFDLVMPHDPSYRLEYTFQEYARIEVNVSSRSKVLEFFTRILTYVKNILLPLITDATSSILEKLHTDRNFRVSRNLLNVYRHGQPGMGSSKDSRLGSPAPSVKDSETGHIGQRLQTMPLDTKDALSVANESMRSGNITPKQLDHTPKIPSNLGPRGRSKRTATEMDEVGDISNSQIENPDFSKRRKRRVAVGLSIHKSSTMLCNGA